MTSGSTESRLIVLFRPPADLVAYTLWHDIETHMGRMRLLWRPGIDLWKAADGQRWTAEFAGAERWKWIGLADELTKAA